MADKIPELPSLEKLPQTPEIRKKYDETLQAWQNFQHDLALLQQAVVEVQKNCLHEIWTPFYWQSTFGGTTEEMELGARTCQICKKVEERPSGSAYEICHKCWAPMRDDGEVRRQGVSMHVYTCTNDGCGNEEYLFH